MLVPCPACQRQASSAAPYCPGCGHPIAAEVAGDATPISKLVSTADMDTLPVGGSESRSAGDPDSVGATHNPLSSEGSSRASGAQSAPHAPDHAEDGSGLDANPFGKKLAHSSFEPPPPERAWSRLGRYAINSSSLLGAQYWIAHAFYAQWGLMTQIQAWIALLSAWWVLVCLTRPKIRAFRASGVPGSKIAAAIALVYALTSMVPGLAWSSPKGWIVTLLWLGLGLGLLLGKVGFRDFGVGLGLVRLTVIPMLASCVKLAPIALATAGIPHYGINPGWWVEATGSSVAVLILLTGVPGRLRVWIGGLTWLLTLGTAVWLGATYRPETAPSWVW